VIDDDLSSLLGRRPSRRPWIELALKQGVAAAIAYLLARQLPDGGGVLIVAPATAATILQGSTSGTARRAFDTIVITILGILVGILMSHWLGLSVLSVLLTITITIILSRPLPLSSEAIAVIALNSLIAGSVSGRLVGYRVLDALIGAGVAVAVLVLVPQRVPLVEARDAVTSWALRQRDLLVAAARAFEADSAQAPLAAEVPSLYAARRNARERLADLDVAVASQWIRRGPSVERSLVHEAYDAVARIHPRVESVVFGADRVEVEPATAEALARCLRRTAALIDTRITGGPIDDGEAGALADDTTRLVAEVFARLGHDDPATWDLLGLVSGLRDIARICQS